MCISMPGRVVEVDDARTEAVVDVGGAHKRVSLVVLTLDGEPIAIGDWLLIDAGFALERMSEAEARGSAELLEQARRAS